MPAAQHVVNKNSTPGILSLPVQPGQEPVSGDLAPPHAIRHDSACRNDAGSTCLRQYDLRTAALLRAGSRGDHLDEFLVLQDDRRRLDGSRIGHTLDCREANWGEEAVAYARLAVRLRLVVEKLQQDVCH